MQERIEFIEGYGADYAVSSLGYVISFKHGKRRVLRWNKNKRGYRYVILCKDGKTKNVRIHRLVAKAMISNPANLPEVNHKDGVKTNNSVGNLEWASGKGNADHAWRTGLLETKLTTDDLALVHALRANGLLQREIAEMVGCSQIHVSRLLRGLHCEYTRAA